MQTHYSMLVSTVIGLSMYAPILLASDIQVSSPTVEPLQLAYVATGGTVKNYGGTRLRYYPNHVIVADSYNKDVIHDIAGLARDLGWDVVYVQVPLEYREYANSYFVGYGIGVNYFGVNVNPDHTSNRFYGHENRHKNRHEKHGGHHNGNHQNRHHGGGHHGGGHHR